MRDSAAAADDSAVCGLPSDIRAESLDSFAEIIVETVLTPLAVIDERFRIETANPAFCKSLGTTLPAIAGLSLFAVGDGRWDIPSFRSALKQVFQTGQQLLESEIEQHLPDTEWKVFLVTSRRIDSPVGRNALCLLTFDDISERKKLADNLAWHSAELKRSNLELEQFAYVSSHDLQEPLRKIRAYGDLLKTEAGEGLNESSRDYLTRMVNAAERMQILINDLLAYSRVATKPPVPKVIDLAKIISEVLGDLDVAIAEARASVTVGDLPKIEADPLQMRQVFQNLVGNALKFRRPGEPVEIQISHSAISSVTSATNPGSRGPVYKFRVADNGIGFDEQYAETIFAPFQRLHSRKTHAGTGIGLAICRRIIERHGGTIRARSSPGAGAIFEFELPQKHSPHRKTP